MVWPSVLVETTQCDVKRGPHCPRPARDAIASRPTKARGHTRGKTIREECRPRSRNAGDAVGKHGPRPLGRFVASPDLCHSGSRHAVRRSRFLQCLCAPITPLKPPPDDQETSSPAPPQPAANPLPETPAWEFGVSQPRHGFPDPAGSPPKPDYLSRAFRHLPKPASSILTQWVQHQCGRSSSVCARRPTGFDTHPPRSELDKTRHSSTLFAFFERAGPDPESGPVGCGSNECRPSLQP